jgi:hypothetical protein
VGWSWEPFLKGKQWMKLLATSILCFIDVLPFFDGVVCPFGYQWMGLTNMEAISSIGIYSLFNIPRTWFEVFFAIAICLLKLLTM